MAEAQRVGRNWKPTGHRPSQLRERPCRLAGLGGGQGGSARLPEPDAQPRVLLRFQEFPASMEDYRHLGRSLCAGVYPEGGVDPEALGNCSRKSYWKYLEGQFTHGPLPLAGGWAACAE